MKSSDEKADLPSFRKRKKEPKNKTAGRPNCLDEEKLGRLLEVYYSRPYSIRELADMFGVSRMTVWRAVQEPPIMADGRAMP